ncbi:MAG: branched-chain amino acid ABC transporter permease [Thermoleophilaceae bacterium]
MFNLRRFSTPLILIALVLLVALVGSTGSEEFQRTIATMLIFVTATVALYLFAGNSGVLMFGHVAFMAVGGYVTAILSIPEGLREATLPNLPGILANTYVEPTVAILIGAVLATVLALAVGIPLMRLHHIAAAIGTLSLLVIVHVIATNWTNVTNGPQTLVGVPLYTTIWNSFPWVALVIVITFAYQQSRWGRRLRASREDLLAAQAIGVRVTLERMVALVLSAFCLGIAGGLLALFLGAFGPEEFYFKLTFLTIAMLVIGGFRSLSGAVIGALVFSTLSDVLRELQDGGIDVLGVGIHPKPGLQNIVLAAVMLAILVFRPDGITRGRELGWRGKSTRPPGSVAPAAAAADAARSSDVSRVG